MQLVLQIQGVKFTLDLPWTWRLNRNNNLPHKGCAHVLKQETESPRLMFWGMLKVCPWWLHYKHTKSHTCTRAHRPGYCLLPMPSPHRLNTYQWGFALVCAGHNYDKWFFLEATEQWRWGWELMWEEDPWDSADVLSWNWMQWLTDWP